MSDEAQPSTLTLDEAYRAAFYLVQAYASRGCDPNGDIPLLLQYMWTDPARWDDWKKAVSRALKDDGAANPDHEGLWRDRGEMPDPPS